MGNERVSLNAAGQVVDLSSVSVLDLQDRVSGYLSKAHALSMMTWADQGEAFRNLSGDIQDEFMWALSGMLDEIRGAWDELEARRASS